MVGLGPLTIELALKRKVCDAFTHPLIVVKSHAGFICFFSDFSDEGRSDVALFDIPPPDPAPTCRASLPNAACGHYTDAADGRHAIAPGGDLPRQIGNAHFEISSTRIHHHVT